MSSFVVRGSHGSLTVGLDGIITEYAGYCSDRWPQCEVCQAADVLEGSSFGLYGLITQFDVREWQETYPNEDITSQTVDILDIGYWQGDTYEPPEEDWRKEIKNVVAGQTTIY